MNAIKRMRLRYCVLSSLVTSMLLVSAGCPSNDNGTNDMGGAGTGAAAAKFSEIYPLIFPADTKAKCNFCHSMPASLPSNGKLSMGMDKDAAYAALVGKSSMSEKCANMPLVVAGKPEMSLMLQKLAGTQTCGSRMPLGATPLTEDQIEMVRSWIAAGAMND